MIDFSNLLDNLLLNSSKKKKIDFLSDYFQSQTQQNKIWALSILSKSFVNKLVKVKDIKELLKGKVDEDLFLYSYDYVGDLAETFSLLWPKDNSKIINSQSLSSFMSSLEKQTSKDDLIIFLTNHFNTCLPNEIYTTIKILLGGLRVGVSNELLKESLSKIGSRSKEEIEENWYGFSFPYNGFFEWLKGESLPKQFNSKDLFHSFMLSNPFNENLIKKIEIKNYTCEYKWDGIRGQITVSNNGKIYSRNGEDITSSFPELKIKSDKVSVLDGELVVKKENTIFSFNELQKRIGRKKVSKKILNDLPVHFICYDILFFNNLDVRKLPFFERRVFLQNYIKKLNHPNISISPLINFVSWSDLRSIKENSLNNHIEGIMLKNKNSIYKSGRPALCWYKWKRDPFLEDFIIMYAQRGHGKRSSFYSDFTFGCWIENKINTLVPIGKAYSGFTNDELKKLDKWVRDNTLDRFGPVRSVKPGLVVEIAFDNLNFSNRHKSGIALRFPRINRIRWDKPIEEVCILDDIKKLIN